MKRLALALSSLLAACDCGGSGPSFPGDENLGSYALHAEGLFAACTLPDLPVSFDFQATLSRFRDGGLVFVTLNGASFDAGFDGQIIKYTQTASDSFYLADGGTCQCTMKVQNTLTLALLSASQSRALGEMCPDDALDGGVPGDNLDGGSLEDAGDGGIRLPQRKADGGFDAVRACGELHKTISGTGFCDSNCYSCKLVYRITGPRQ